MKHALDVNVLILKMEGLVAQIRYSGGGGYSFLPSSIVGNKNLATFQWAVHKTSRGN